MIDVSFALAFTTGMVATVNPCGFAMLPAYLSFFVGASNDRDRDVTTAVGRALVVGLAVTVGFASTFAVVGMIVNLLTDDAYRVAPWLSVVIGVALVAFGIALLAGFELNLRLPHLDRGGRTTGIASMALFGVSYAIASLGCTLPLFVLYTSANFGRGFASGVAFFLGYAAGFGLVLTSLTIALSLARQSLVLTVRRVLPYVNRIAGALLVVAGAYVAYYGTVEIRQGSQPGGVRAGGVVDRVTGWSSDITNWIDRQPEMQLGLVLVSVVAVAAVFALVARRRTS